MPSNQAAPSGEQPCDQTVERLSPVAPSPTLQASAPTSVLRLVCGWGWSRPTAGGRPRSPWWPAAEPPSGTDRPIRSAPAQPRPKTCAAHTDSSVFEWRSSEEKSGRGGGDSHDPSEVTVVVSLISQNEIKESI